MQCSPLPAPAARRNRPPQSAAVDGLASRRGFCYLSAAMAGPFPSASSEPRAPEEPPGTGSSSRLGLVLFALYLAAYTLFVVLNVFSPHLMEAVPFAGVNLAILYGMALIGGALVLALLYAFLLRSKQS